MNIEELPPDVQFNFLAMLQSAINMKEKGCSKKFYLEFASEIWDTMGMSDIEYLKDVLRAKMMCDIKDFIGDK